MRAIAALIMLTGLSAAGREPVIVDTDSGQFGDDGAALVMLLRSPAQVAVSGITVVSGNVWIPQGAEYMHHLLDLLEQPQVTVYAGAQSPLIHTPELARDAERKWGKHDYIGAFAQDPAEVRPATGAKLTGRRPRPGAVEFLIAEIERRPGAITVLALGPMTNIALALKLKPEIETRIKRLVFMGGSLKARGNTTPAAEFNFWFDPEAARIVLRSRIPEKVMFGLDICNTAPLRKAQFDEIIAAGTPVTALFREDFGNGYPGFLKNPDARAHMWDSLAAAYILDPGFVTKSETHYLDVVTSWGRFYGSVVPLDRRTAPVATPVTVARQLDYARVYNIYKDRLTQPR